MQVRPPQPVVILFLIDVTSAAIQSGMLAIAADTILRNLRNIPDADGRARVGFITFDASLHFYNLAAGLTDPEMMIVSDLEDPFLPVPCDLLVPLGECRATIETFLGRLPRLHGTSHIAISVLGKALKFAEKLIAPIGGKIVVFQHALPNQDAGMLKPREDPKLFGTPKEVSLLQPAIPYYKNIAVECSPSQVSIDMFLFSSAYADLATLSGCAKFTGGNVFYYPKFNAAMPEDAMKFSHELGHLLSRPLGLEAVLRVRASNGIKMTAFHGNFFLRSTDLLSLPNVNPDNSYAIELAINENLTTPTVCFQAALLHTSSTGIICF